MALPKRRHSKARGAKRRANWKLTAPCLSVCPSCHKPKLPHVACPECGQYNGRLVIEVKKKKRSA